MSDRRLGMDIGASGLKLALVAGGRVERLTTAPLPEQLIREGRVVSEEVLSREIKGILKRERIRVRECALALPADTAYVRKVTMPYMTAEHLKLNLPYEFHDYIQSDKSLYFYDYAVLETRTDEDGKPVELELLAAAAPREAIAQYRTALRKAGLKLTIAVPEVLTYRNIIRAYEARTSEHPAEYCIADLGHNAIRIHIYRGAAHETTRVIEFGGRSMDTLIADALNVDPHAAANYKAANYNGVQELPACRDLYSHIALEIMRAVNFYGFNTPDSNLQDLYASGGLSSVPLLMEEIRNTLSLRCHAIESLLPPGAEGEDRLACAAAIGAALQGKGRTA